VETRADSSRASTAWSIPEIRVVKDDQGRLRIDQTDPATYGAYAARQFLAIAKADPSYRDVMTKRPSAPSMKIAYVNVVGKRVQIGVKEIFCRMDGDALVLTQFENAAGEKVTDLPISVPVPAEPDHDVDDADRLHELVLAELDDAPSPPPEIESKPEAPRPAPPPVRRMPSGPLRQYDQPADPAAAPKSAAPVAPPAPEPPPRSPIAAPRSPAAVPPVTKTTKATTSPPAAQALRAIDEREAAALRALIESKAGETRWANGLLMQAAERHPSDRKLQNEYLANLLRVSLDPSRSESQTPLGVALRGIIEEVHAYKPGVLDRDPLKAEKVALQPLARIAFAPPPEPPPDDGQIKTVFGTTQRTPAQVLAKLEDPKLARATRVKLLLEVVPELIDAWRPDKESSRSEAGNESSPAIVRRMFAVANEQRQQRKFIDDGSSFKKAGERYAVLESKLPKPSALDDT
jgi:hypothetical protein